MRRCKDILYMIIGLSILGFPLFVLLAGGVNQGKQPPTPTASPELKSACQYRSPDGRFCAGALDFAGVMVQANDGRFLHASLWKWNDFVGWAQNSRYALFENHDQYGNNFGLILDTELWEVWRPEPETNCVLNMSALCQHGFALTDLAAGWVILGTGVRIDLASRAETHLFPPSKDAVVGFASLSPDKNTIAYFGAAEIGEPTLGDTIVTLYVANAAGTDITAVPALSFELFDLDYTELVWLENGRLLQFQTDNEDTYLYTLQTGEWEVKVE